MIKSSALRGRLLTWFDWGQYAIWHFPNLRVSLDGRRETVYSEAFVSRHVRLYFDPATEQRLLAELRPDFAWLPSTLPLTVALENAGWHRIFGGSQSVVLSREPVEGLLPPVLGSACFPGP